MRGAAFAGRRCTKEKRLDERKKKFLKKPHTNFLWHRAATKKHPHPPNRELKVFLCFYSSVVFLVSYSSQK